MKIKKRLKSPLDSTASGVLSDLGFLLIIYFIVIAGFNINQGFLLNLPQKNSTKIVNVEDIIKLYLNENGDLIYNDNVISIRDISEIISDKIVKRPNMTLFLKISPETPYQKVVNIVNLAKDLNIENFSFTMQ